MVYFLQKFWPEMPTGSVNQLITALWPQFVFLIQNYVNPKEKTYYARCDKDTVYYCDLKNYGSGLYNA